MKHAINSLIGYKLQALDGKIGKLTEFYFDDETWNIKYLVIKPGNWFSVKQVLLSPNLLLQADNNSKIFPVNLTIEEIKNSPDIETDKPVSRIRETQYYGHNAWQRGGGGFYEGNSINNISIPSFNKEKTTDFYKTYTRSENNIHLRSTYKVKGYQVKTIDGSCGHLKDFIWDNQTGQIIMLVIDIGNWIFSRYVLLAVEHVEAIIWKDFEIRINISCRKLKSGAPWKPGQIV